jgi:hypothetical protein
VRSVATDRYRLAVRTLRPYACDGNRDGDGGACHLLAEVEELTDVASWSLPLPAVRIHVDAHREARLHAGQETRTLPTVEATFPDYRMILDGLPAARNPSSPTATHSAHSLLTPPEATRSASAPGISSCTSPAPTSRPPHRAPCSGPPLRIAFDPGVLVPALDAGIGPDVLLEVSSATEPVIIRSADQGSFTTLAMPVRDVSTDA